MMKSYNPTAEVPLRGVRVLDLSRLVSGNMLTHVLADLGAEVVKVERPKVGDDLRNWGVDGIQTYWKIYARNKKSLTLNLRSEQGHEILLQLAEHFHVLVYIRKPFPASFFQRKRGAIHIMMDDVVAGIYANLAAHFLFWSISSIWSS